MTKGRKVPDRAIDHAAQLRERLGRVVRDAWIAWAKEQEETKDSWWTPWEELAEPFKEADRRIGWAVMEAIVGQGHRMGQISVASTYGAATKQPYVELTLDTSPAQVSPAKAREIALMLLEAADASESDAVLMAFAREQIGLDEVRSAQLLDQFRKHRERQRGGKADAA